MNWPDNGPRGEGVVFTEEDLLPVSALQHLVFCPRRAALIYIEEAWADNEATAQGTALHDKVHAPPPAESRGEVRIAWGLALRSLRLGLVGKADVVEFHLTEEAGVELLGLAGRWRPFPVEYKRGRLRREEGYLVQLCAQALCLEEMLKVDVPAGAIFYGQPKRRLEVIFDQKLRRQTEEAASQLHQLFRARLTPPAKYEKKCESCSLMDLCLPRAGEAGGSVRKYLSSAFSLSEDE